MGIHTPYIPCQLDILALKQLKEIRNANSSITLKPTNPFIIKGRTTETKGHVSFQKIISFLEAEHLRNS